MKLSLRTTSSQRWAIGAVALALLFACSPKAPEEPAVPAPQGGPQLSSTPAVTVAPAIVTPAATPPGYAANWALLDADCSDPARTFKLSGETLDMTPDKRTCQVKSISSETPTGRSMIYTVKADCLAAGQTSQDTIKLNFGASDTVMQLQLNDGAPVRLTRCGA